MVGEGGGYLKEGGTKPKARISKEPAIPWVEWGVGEAWMIPLSQESGALGENLCVQDMHFKGCSLNYPKLTMQRGL